MTIILDNYFLSRPFPNFKSLIVLPLGSGLAEISLELSFFTLDLLFSFNFSRALAP